MNRLPSSQYLMDELTLAKRREHNYAQAFLASVVLHALTLLVIVWMFL